ncbi:MAG: hypothetical protein AUK48_02310 [Oscillatoriales cyanobacterium CG2_30_44_21]|nr:MAG: hypothetical protein AUK48_02310 [Oscillatoriales cyanobacterium CG2_30_44_21]
MNGLLKYFGEIKLAKSILWCYLIWYIVIVIFYFDPAPKIWINSVGISAIIGTGLMLSVSSSNIRREYWQIFRLYLMPFCVSSFAALIKDQGFIVFISPKLIENTIALSACVIFLAAIALIKFLIKK